MAIFVGTSGWQYRSWRGGLYPPGLPGSRWLEHYALSFATVEANGVFYRLPAAATFEAWAARTPADFVMALKASRFLTHVRRLRAPEEPVARLLGRAAGLGPKLGPVLLQLPPDMRADPNRLEAALACFPARVRVAVEFRHGSWFSTDVRSLLERRGAALCLADSPERRTPVWRTAAWGYLRLHQGRARPWPCYGPGALRSWATRLTEAWTDDEDVFVYFNNDPHGCAVRDARRFGRTLERAGRTVGRVPGAAATRLTGLEAT